MLTFAVVYIVLLCLAIAFMVGASIVNEQWDKSYTLAPQVDQPTKNTEVDLQTKNRQSNPPDGFGSAGQNPTQVGQGPRVWPIDPKVFERGHYGPR
jgi:hypothetical protein